MKRTKHINKDAFRKSWQTYRLAPIALAISAVFTLSGCEEADQTVTMYQNADDCSSANPSMKDQCTTAYQQALKEAVKTAPKYATKEDCVAEFGEAQCASVPEANQSETSNQTAHSGGSWMPLMAGYMMGRMMGGGMSQPLFTSKSATSPMNGKFVDASGRNYGSATYGRTTTVDPKAMAPKPATTTTTTRGGFGESVAKQNALARSQATSSRSSSSSSSRSYGG